MGEAESEERALVTAVRGAIEEQAEQAAELRVSTPGGRFQVRWDEGGSASALGQLAFFAEFLEHLVERRAEGDEGGLTCGPNVHPMRPPWNMPAPCYPTPMAG